MTLHIPNPNPNAFVRLSRRIYHPIGFQKGYNFILFFTLAGALFGFGLARTPYINVTGTFLNSAAPGEAYWYRQNWYSIGIHIHLLTCIPAAILAPFQFVPVLRHKALPFHRINGYLVMLLLLTTNVGAVMIARRAFGGSLATQAATGFLAVGTTVSATLAFVNIKRLQIEQHRAWMLRTWVLTGGIVTARLIQVIGSKIISAIGSYYTVIPCAQIEDMGGNMTRYLACREDAAGYTVVHANWDDPQGVEEVAATLQMTFGMALWLTIALHVLGVELYLHLTKAETERLRKVSYERQLERGMRQPGSAGVTSDKLGDEEKWRPGDKISAEVVDSEGHMKQAAFEVDSGSETDVSKPPRALGWS